MNHDDIKLALFEQVPWLVVCQLVMDGGGVFGACFKALVLYWVFVALSIVVLHERDKLWLRRFVRWGLFPMFAVAWFVFPPEPLRIPMRQRAEKNGAMKTTWREDRTGKRFQVTCDV